MASNAPTSSIALPKTAPLVTLFVSQLASVIIGLVGEFSSADMTSGQIIAIMGAADFVGIALAFVLWVLTVSKKEVVEKLLSDGTVVAGEANERAVTGDYIRELDSPVSPGVTE